MFFHLSRLVSTSAPAVFKITREVEDRRKIGLKFFLLIEVICTDQNDKRSAKSKLFAFAVSWASS